MSINEKLNKIESLSRKLEPKAEERRYVEEQVLAFADLFLSKTKSSKSSYSTPSDSWGGFEPQPEGEPIADALEEFRSFVVEDGLNPTSDRYMGYVPGGGVYYAALGDYLAAVTNKYAGMMAPAPGATKLENSLIGWVAGELGYPAEAAGNLSSGGSISTLTAIVTAKKAKGIKARDIENCTVYITEHTHRCFDKALQVAGLEEMIVRRIAVDENYCMDASALEKQIKLDVQNGLKPFFLIGSAGTTDTGSIDPLTALGRISKENGLWFHVDGAYGGLFVLTEEGKKRLKGIELSDSVVMDPHKSLFLPYGCGMVIVKDRRLLLDAFSYDAHYLQDVPAGGALSAADMSPELTKHFRGMRMWLPLKLLGTAPFVACLEEKLLLADYFYDEIQKIEGFEVFMKPQLSIVAFRYLPKNGDADEFNKKMIKEIQLDGEIYISSTMLDGKFALRMAILSFRTHKDSVDRALQVLSEKVKMMGNA